MTTDDIIQIVTTVGPTLLLIFGGQWILNRYETMRKAKEQEIQLVRSIREQQYEAVESLYHLFARFMALYRKSKYYISDYDTQRNLLTQAIEAESEIDALILRIGSEFVQRPGDELESLLGNLRQSVQLWRKKFKKGEKLPFYSSDQEDYIRFKKAFAETAVFMVNQIYGQLEPPQMKKEQSKSLLLGAFSNKYEFRSYRGRFSGVLER
ncbi:MAG: hypothetical protein HXS54_10780 [Theionarchaea archaeon]|nr:hypothetical protein [Theionarchaea archaeon]